MNRLVARFIIRKAFIQEPAGKAAKLAHSAAFIE